MRRIAAIITTFIALLCCGCGASQSNMTITFFDVGKADCLLMQTPDGTLMIDAGTQKDGVEVAAQLKAMGVDVIDTFILTHFDKDHVGGAEKIIREFGVKRIYRPKYMKESEYSAAFMAAAESVAAEVTTVKNTAERLTYEGGVTLEIYPPEKDTYEKDQSNNSSLVITVVHGDNSFLFTGDAEAERIAELEVLLSDGYDFLKVPHHGVYENCLPAFFEAVGAKDAVITSSNKNPEDTETIEALKNVGSRVWLTKNGAVTLKSNGKSISISQ